VSKLLTRQDIFDLAINGIIAQGAFSVTPRDNLYRGGQCLYRGPNNTRCAIGMLIPDKEYDPVFEGLGVNEVLKHNITFNMSFALDIDVTFLSSLQSVHDVSSSSTDPWPIFQRYATKMANQYKLSLKNITFKKDI
jgi:hypothetical protein